MLRKFKEAPLTPEAQKLYAKLKIVKAKIDEGLIGLTYGEAIALHGKGN